MSQFTIDNREIEQLDDVYTVHGEGGAVHVGLLEDLDNETVTYVTDEMEKKLAEAHAETDAHIFEFPLPKPIHDDESRKFIKEQRRGLGNGNYPSHASKRRK